MDEQGYTEDAARIAHNYFKKQNWVDKYGEEVTDDNFKTKCSWVMKSEYKKTTPITKGLFENL